MKREQRLTNRELQQEGLAKCKDKDVVIEELAPIEGIRFWVRKSKSFVGKKQRHYYIGNVPIANISSVIPKTKVETGYFLSINTHIGWEKPGGVWFETIGEAVRAIRKELAGTHPGTRPKEGIRS